MKRQYKEFSFKPETLAQIGTINAVITDFVAQGFSLSVRQLYYQLVGAALIENTERSYKNVADLINRARLAGLMDWDAITDRGRNIELRTRWVSGQQISQASADSYHMDMWVNQTSRVFCVVEKQALEDVLSKVCRTWDVPLLAAKGYPSVSIVRDLVEDYIKDATNNDQHAVLLHFGDHDPSGKDMTRDLQERIDLFLDGEGTCEVIRMALNIDQVRRLKLPPNPTKISDSRAKAYMAEFGKTSWELDALRPQYIADLAGEAIEQQIDPDAWEERKQEVEDIRAQLQANADRFAQ